MQKIQPIKRLYINQDQSQESSQASDKKKQQKSKIFSIESSQEYMNTERQKIPSSKDVIQSVQNSKIQGSNIQAQKGQKIQNKQQTTSNKYELKQKSIIPQQKEQQEQQQINHLSLKQHSKQSTSKTYQNLEEDDLLDDMLNDSMELKESASIEVTAIDNRKQGQTNYSTDKSTPITSSINANSSNTSQNQQNNSQINNIVNPTSPSKLNSKFQPQKSSTAQLSHRSSNLGIGSKQQNIKQSVVQQKKTLVSLHNDKEQSIATSEGQGKSNSQLLDLNLSLSNITRVPYEQISNQSLRSIDLRNNKINDDGLIPELFQLQNVWKLQLDNNQISNLPDNFQDMIGLRHLTVSQNQLQSLPDSLCQLKNLEKLDISQNKMEILTGNISQLVNLKYLFLQGNNISKLPIQISQLKQLQQLSLEWFQYIQPLFEKLIKRNIPAISNSSYNMPQEESLLAQILTAIGRSSKNKQDTIDFLSFIQNLYGLKDMKQLFNDFYINKQSNIIHFMCKYQHLHLFELALVQIKYIDINAIDENGQSALIIAMNEQSTTIVDKILRNFSDQLDLQQNQQIYLRQSNISSNSMTKTIVVHPLLLAVRNLLYDTAKRILKIMINKHNKQLQSSQSQQVPSFILQSVSDNTLDLNFKDEHRNTLIHYIFANFSENMALSVELCQELLKQMEIGQKSNPPTVVLKLNEINKQGMTPFDLAVESKQNLAVEFAIYYNKNLLPPFQSNKSSKKKIKKETFDVNFNKNHLGITPLHRAVLSKNHKAIFLLLSSGLCDIFKYDNEYKTARDLCLKVKYLYQYIRKGELNQIRQVISTAHKQLEDENRLKGVNDQTLKVKASNNFNARTLSLTKPLQHNNINLYQMSQKRGNRVKYNSWYTRVGAYNGMVGNSNALHVSSRQHTQERNIENDFQGSDQEQNDDVQIEDVEDDNDQENIDDENISKSNSLVQDSIVKGDRKANSILKPSITITMAERRLSDQGGSTKKQKESMFFKNLQTTTQKPKIDSPGKEKKPIQIKTIQDRKPRLQQGTPDIIDFGNQKNQQLHSTPKQQLSFKEDNNLKLQIREEIEDYNLSGGDDEEIEEIGGTLSNIESPSALPSNKYKHVMAVNNSKLSRKPYYKQILKNRYEREFCIIMDNKVSIALRLQTLFQVFTQVQQQITSSNKEVANSVYKDGREFLGFLKLELDNKDFNLQPLKNEILYFQETMMSYQSNLNIVIPNDTIQVQGRKRKNTNNFSLERGPLPMIQETNTENTNISPVKKSVQTQEIKSTFGLNQIALQSKTMDFRNQKQIDNHANSKLTQSKHSNSSKNLDQIVSQKSYVSQLSNKSDLRDQSPPSSPKGNSGQVISKLGMTSQSLNLSSPQTTPSHNQQYSGIKKITKDSCVKKIEVQIQNVDKSQMNQSSDKLNKKWKQLQINPNSTSIQNQSSTSITKITQRQGSFKNPITPQSQKNSQQFMNLLHGNNNTSSNQTLTSGSSTQRGGNPQQQINTQSSGTTIIVQQANNKTSSSLSNRSNSNPRNSLLNQNTFTTNQYQLLKSQTNKQNGTSGIKTSQVSVFSSQKSQQKSTLSGSNINNQSLLNNTNQQQQTTSSFNTNNSNVQILQQSNNSAEKNTNNTTGIQNSVSKLKSPNNIKNYTRNTIGKTNPIVKK